MKARLEAALRRLGAAGVLGVGLALACAGFYVSALAPLEKEAAAKTRGKARRTAETK